MKIKSLFLINVFTIVYSFSFCQSINSVSETEAKEFFNKTKDVLKDISSPAYLALIDDSYRGTTITLRPKRPPTVVEEDYEKVIKLLEQATNPNNQYHYKEMKLESIVLNDPYAIVSYSHSFYFTRNEEKKFDATSNGTIVLKKFNDKKIKIITKSVVTNIPSEYIGNCFCRFDVDRSNYRVNVEYPYGSRFEYVTENIYSIPDNPNLFTYYGKMYHWDGQGTVFRYNPNTDSDLNEVSKANSLKMAMAKVIQAETFQNVCINMRVYSQ